MIAEQFLHKYKNPDSICVAVLYGDRDDLHLNKLCWCNARQFLCLRILVRESPNALMGISYSSLIILANSITAIQAY